MFTNARFAVRLSALAVAGALVSSAAFAQGGITDTKQGKGGSVVQGAAGTNGSLVNSASNKCLDANGASTADGTQLIIWTCHGGTNQRWTLP